MNGNFTETLPAIDTITMDVAIINPASSEAFINLSKEATSLSVYAAERVIASNEDVKNATDDLGLISKLTKSVDELRTSYVKPLNDKVKGINDTFKTLSTPLDMANQQTLIRQMAEINRFLKQEIEIIEIREQNTAMEGER